MTIKPARRPDLFVKTRVRYERSPDLVREIKAALPTFDDDERHEFLVAIEDEIVTYLSSAPRYAAFHLIRRELEKLETGAKAFALAAKALNPETLNRLRLGFGMNARKSGASDFVGEADSFMVEFTRSGEIANKTAETATRLLKELMRPPKEQKRQPVPKDAVNQLVFAAACAYGDAFGSKAGPTKTGLFAKVLPTILREVGIEGSMGEDRLKEILKRETLPGKKPKRGRKPSKRN